MKLLKDPDIWMADAGAAAHSAPCKHEFKKKNFTKGHMTVGNGQVDSTNCHGGVLGVMHGKSGNFMQARTMTEIGCVPTKNDNCTVCHT